MNILKIDVIKRDSEMILVLKIPLKHTITENVSVYKIALDAAHPRSSLILYSKVCSLARGEKMR